MGIETFQQLNLAYLLAAQRLLRSDRKSGLRQLAIDEDTADYILSRSPLELSSLARSADCRHSLRPQASCLPADNPSDR